MNYEITWRHSHEIYGGGLKQTLLETDDHARALDELQSPSNPLPERAFVELRHSNTGHRDMFCIVVEGQVKRIPFIVNIIENIPGESGRYDQYKFTSDLDRYWRSLNARGRFRLGTRVGVPPIKLQSVCFELIQQSMVEYPPIQAMFAEIKKLHAGHQAPDLRWVKESVTRVQDDRRRQLKRAMQWFASGVTCKSTQKFRDCLFELARDENESQVIAIVDRYIRLDDIAACVAEEIKVNAD